MKAEDFDNIKVGDILYDSRNGIRRKCVVIKKSPKKTLYEKKVYVKDTDDTTEKHYSKGFYYLFDEYELPKDFIFLAETQEEADRISLEDLDDRITFYKGEVDRLEKCRDKLLKKC